MTVTAYTARGLTGGTGDDLDFIDGAGLVDNDFAFVFASSKVYVYLLDATSGAAESSPSVISPDTNPGTKRWLLLGVQGLAAFFTDLTATGTSTLADVDIAGGEIDGTPIGANSPSTGAFTTLSATGDIDCGAQLTVGGSSGVNTLNVLQSGVGDMAGLRLTDATQTTSLNLLVTSSKAANTDFSMVKYLTGTTSPIFDFRGDGTGFGDVAWTTPAADYAEYFEWEDGNINGEDRVGFSVSLIGEKIKIAGPGDIVIGVVSGQPAFISNNAWNNWAGKNVKDDFGRYVLEEYDAVEWEEEVKVETKKGEKPKFKIKKVSYAIDEIPEGVNVPATAKQLTQNRRTLSPGYDETQPYTPREFRPEWDAIGLIGKLSVRKGQKVNPNWIKLRKVSNNVDEYLVR